MSIPVPLDELGVAVTARGFGYLVTVGEDARPKVLALVPEVVPDDRRGGVQLHFAVGTGGTARNLAVHPDVTVVFPPGNDDPYSLVVDGRAELRAGRAVVTPSWAVRHRPAT